MKGSTSQKLPACDEVFHMGCTLRHHLLLFGLAQAGPSLLVEVGQEHVFHFDVCLRVYVEWRAPKSTTRQAFFYHRFMQGEADRAVEEVYRSDWGRIVATLIRLVGDFELAEEAAQEAFSAAVDQWRAYGVPQFP